VVIGVAVALAMANKWNEQRKEGAPRQVREKLQTLMIQAVQYSGQAQQDQNPMFALLHANYAIAYLTVARSLASDETIASLTGYSPQKLYPLLMQAQQDTMQSLAKFCTSQSQTSTAQHTQYNERVQQLGVPGGSQAW
jgi:hypothetical protein